MKKTPFKTICTMGMLCLLSSSILLTSCSSDDEDYESPQTEDTGQRTDGRRLRQLTIADVPITRATLSDNTTTLGAAWTATDKATYFNLTSFTDGNMDKGTLTAASSGATSTFTGSVTCKKDDQIALIYPATEPATTGDNRGKFVISLSGQKGTLDDIATRFHYVYGVGLVKSVTEAAATATISSMTSLLAVAKFTFTDGTNTIPVKTLSIEYCDKNSIYGVTSLNYPLTGTVTPSTGNVAVDPAAPSEWDDPLTITLDAETSSGVYVALFPVSGYSISFSVTNSSGTYTGTATATLKAGKYYPVSLKLTKQ